jgi:hypothetical protein
MRACYLVVLSTLGLLLSPLHAEQRPGAPDSLAASRFQLFPETAAAYKPVTRPSPLSTSSFAVGFDMSATRLVPAQTYRLPGMGGIALMPSQAHAHKDLPFGFDIGAFYGQIPGSGLQVFGAEARYALIPDSMVLPTIGLRASYSTLQGSDRLALNTRGIDLSLSKGFSLITPYAGLGSVWVDSDPHEGMGLAREYLHHDKYFIGANFHLQAMNFAVEADRTGDITHYQARFGWRW